MNQPRHILSWAGCAFLATASACEHDPDPALQLGNQDPVTLDICPALPPGVAPIEGLTVAHAVDRFGGVTLTLSTRALACGEPAVQHGVSGLGDDGDGLGLTVGIPAEQAVVGSLPLAYPLHVEFEAPNLTAVGGGGELRDASIELFELDDTCVTGRIVGLVEAGGPFDGGFQAPRCTP